MYRQRLSGRLKTMFRAGFKNHYSKRCCIMHGYLLFLNTGSAGGWLYVSQTLGKDSRSLWEFRFLQAFRFRKAGIPKFPAMEDFFTGRTGAGLSSHRRLSGTSGIYAYLSSAMIPLSHNWHILFISNTGRQYHGHYHVFLSGCVKAFPLYTE